MATLYDTIKAASPIAFWPLIDNKDHSGNSRHLVAHGSPAFGMPPMNGDLLPSMQSGNTDATLRIEQSTLPKIVAMEGWFRLSGAKIGAYSTVFGLNQPLSGFENRYIMIYHNTLGFCSYRNGASGAPTETFVSSKTWEELSSGPHHVVLQYEAASNSTRVYIDGALDTGMTMPGDVFMQRANTYLVIGAYYYNGSASGNGQLSHVAAYGRELTQEEITSRQSFVIGEPVFKPPVRVTVEAANQEPRSQFQPQDVAWRGTPPMYAGPVNLQQQTQYPLCKGRDYVWIRDGVRNVEQGFIESTVTISGMGVRRRVLCYTQDGELVGETYSRP